MQDRVIFTVERIERDPDGYTIAYGCGTGHALLYKGSCGTFPAHVRPGDRVEVSIFSGIVCSWEVTNKGSSL
jgi:hypothetical protein